MAAEVENSQTSRIMNADGVKVEEVEAPKKGESDGVTADVRRTTRMMW